MTPRRFWRAKFYGSVERLLNISYLASVAIHEGFGLGILDRESINFVTSKHYSNNSNFRASHYILSGLWSWETDVFDRFFNECRSILLGAAGGGREVFALFRRGVQVDGFDCSEKLVETCRDLLVQQGIQSKIILSLPDKVPDGFETYDGLVIGWGGYSHIAGRDTRVQFLKQLRHHVRAASPILLSFFAHKSESSFRNRLVFFIARILRFLRRSPEGVELGDTLAGGFYHYFTKKEIEEELKDSGFLLEYYSEDGFGHAVARSKN